MTTYAIGDLQGCRPQLEQLLDEIAFDPTQDQLWFAGDLVNRGPDSLGTLRLLYSLRDNVRLVLGNHDLHMLAAACCRELGNRKDTFYDIIDAEDGPKLLSWLKKQPLLIENDDFLLVHAGLYPDWSLAQTRRLAAEVESVLQSDRSADFYQAMYGNEPSVWSEDLRGMARLRFITNVFSRMRFCDQQMALQMHYKGDLQSAPSDLIPWYQMGQPDLEGKTLLIGHWAALQKPHPVPWLVCLDSGCVWGHQLSAYALETRRWFHVSGYQAVS